MADDYTQRPYRSSDSIARAVPARPVAGSGNDPLAELARLIGQNDPFSEYGRNQQVAPPVEQAEPIGAGSAPDYHAAPTAPTLPPLEAPPGFGRHPFGSAPLAGDFDPNQVAVDERGYPVAPQDSGYQDDGYHPDQAHLDGAHGDYYEDAPPSRRRMTIMVIAGVFALAVIGSAAAFGYRALFASYTSSGPPPVIKADTAPSKIVPATARDASSKPINDRVGGQTELLVSREEQPVDIKDRQPPFPPPADQANNQAPAQGSGVVSPDAKRVRTIAIHPDQSVVTDASPTAAPPSPAAAAPAQQPRVTAVAQPKQVAPSAPPPPQTPPRVVASAPPAEQDAEPARPPAPKKPAVPLHQASANAPLSLSPDAPAPARSTPRPAAPTRTASAPAQPAAPAAGGGYAVQVSSQRSEAEAQAAFRSLQSKYPDQLGNKQPVIRKVELGEKGTFYRALVPLATGNEATQLCSSLKAAGGSCLIQRN